MSCGFKKQGYSLWYFIYAYIISVCWRSNSYLLLSPDESGSPVVVLVVDLTEKHHQNHDLF